MDGKKLLTFEDVVNFYSIKPHGLRHLLRHRLIPFIRLGRGRGRIYFSPDDLDHWIKERKIKVYNGGVKHG